MKNERPILLDVTRLIWRCWAGRQPTGIDRVCMAYLAHYRSQAQAVIQYPRLRTILSVEASDRLFDLLLTRPSNFRLRLVTAGFRRAGHFLTGARGNNRLYLNTGHTGLNRRGYVDWIRRANVRSVYLVHDLIPLTHPQFCKSGEDERHRFRMMAVLATAHGIIGNSQDTVRVFAEFASDSAGVMPPSLVAWLGTEDLPAPVATSPSATPYFITVGTIEGRKNHALLLDAWLLLIARMGAAAPLLVIVGQRGWANAEVLARLDQDQRLKSHILEISNSDDATLATWLAHAKALLFPTFAEGFGMPLIEALAAGTPAIVSDIAVFREIAGDIPDYLSSDDVAGWTEQVFAYAQTESIERKRQMLRMQGYEKPTWTNHFRRVDDWLTTLSSGALIS